MEEEQESYQQRKGSFGRVGKSKDHFHPSDYLARCHQWPCYQTLDGLFYLTTTPGGQCHMLDPDLSQWVRASWSKTCLFAQSLINTSTCPKWIHKNEYEPINANSSQLLEK